MVLLEAIPEKQPALLSLIYTAGLALMIVWLAAGLLRSMRRRRSALGAVAPADLPAGVRDRLGVTSTNRGLYALRWLFVVLALAVFGFHVYWAIYAEEKNERFQELSYKDLRNRRLSESTLRGWILDRTGSLESALALYRVGSNGRIEREYPLDREMAHLLGTERGDAGLERALFGISSGAVPEALDVAFEENIKQPANLDVQLTIHGEMQKAVMEQLKDRHGAAVIINPQSGEVLAMYSNPAYSLKEVADESTWIRLDTNKKDAPLVNRALRSYYIPGSTFKTVTMIAQFIHGTHGEKYLCSGNGYYAQPGAKVIYDDQGPAEVHGMIGVDKAYEVSCNQYFAQAAVKLGPEKMRQAAELVGINAYEDPADAVRGRRQPDIWNTSTPAIARAIAPAEATMVTKVGMRPYDLAIEGFGQGYAGQMTPFQMALSAAAVANLEGKLMKPKIELNLPPQVYHQVVTPEKAAEMRRIMGLVTRPDGSGTARGVFAPVWAAGISSGGKTGTAQKDVPEYDPRTGEPKTVKKYERDRRGNIIREYEQLVISEEKRIDSWYLSIAPLEYPQIAMAVIIEGGGYGSRAAAPVAAALVLKAKELGLLGPQGQPAGQPQQQQPNAQQPNGQPDGQRRQTAPRPQASPRRQPSPARNANQRVAAARD
ncbi:MAG TPA: penicillin-binding transpeptidase domain-containing protein [Pyrinomonadaceae bacterium]|nr:penicillin-binding transpeptidase domain-containing protein [Pyrinomonadaceae bacterium]